MNLTDTLLHLLVSKCPSELFCLVTLIPDHSVWLQLLFHEVHQPLVRLTRHSEMSQQTDDMGYSSYTSNELSTPSENLRSQN